MSMSVSVSVSVSMPVFVCMPVSVSVSVSESESESESESVRMSAMCLYVLSFAPTFVSVCIHDVFDAGIKIKAYFDVSFTCIYDSWTCIQVAFAHIFVSFIRRRACSNINADLKVPFTSV